MHRILFVILVISLLYFSCNNCEDEPSEIFKKGSSFANGSSQDFGSYAIFVNERIPDPDGGWKHDPNKRAIMLTRIEDCVKTEQIVMSNLNIPTGDTTFLHFESSNHLPTAKLFLSNGDNRLGSYDLIENSKSWILVDSVNSDTTEVSGQFNLSFAAEDGGINNKPDSLFYSNGEFTAEFGNF